jgi:4-hydroxy-4-methyl-2-oxoglutarate aldolase
MASDHHLTPLDSATVATLLELGTTTLHEAQGQRGHLPTDIRPLYRGAKVAGRALPVKVGPGDNLALHQAIVVAKLGDVIVASCGDYLDAGVWGEVMTIAAQQRGIAGLVVDGSVRDIDQIEALGFPVFSRGVCMRGTTKTDPADFGPITIDGVTIEPGDTVVGDSDGVMVIPSYAFDAVVDGAKERAAKEADMMAKIRSGVTTLDLLGLQPATVSGSAS